jgi:hypothetical protein
LNLRQLIASPPNPLGYSLNLIQIPPPTEFNLTEKSGAIRIIRDAHAAGRGNAFTHGTGSLRLRSPLHFNSTTHGVTTLANSIKNPSPLGLRQRHPA